MTRENLLTGSSCPSGLIGPQYPVRGDQYVIPLVTTPPPPLARHLFLRRIALLPFYYFSEQIDAGKQADCKPHRN